MINFMIKFCFFSVLLQSLSSAYYLQSSFLHSFDVGVELRLYSSNTAVLENVEKLKNAPIILQNGKNKGNYNARGVDVNGYFSERPIKQHTADKFIKEKLSQCGKYEITALFRLLGKKSKYQRNPLLQTHLPAIVLRLSMISSKWTYTDISFLCYGLQQFTFKDNGVLDIISFINSVKINTQKAPKMQGLSMIYIYEVYVYIHEVYIYIHINIHLYIYIHMKCLYIYIYIYIEWCFYLTLSLMYMNR
jgi:hypothetical protein